ncbi:right-handed parallel beta-helix repeat-containing protein [Streptomyces sp. M19]
MTAGATAAAGTWISGSRASWTSRASPSPPSPRRHRPAPADAEGRPYLSMGAAGRMDIRRSTVTGFGRGGRSSPPRTRASPGAGEHRVGHLQHLRGQPDRDATGGLHRRRPENVKAKESARDGVVLKDDRGTTVTRVSAEANGRTGIAITGTDGRTLSGLSSHGNHGAGIKASDQRGLRLVAPSSRADTGGVKLINCARCVVHKAKVEGRRGWR